MRSFGDLEARIMATLWSVDDGLTVREVVDRLSRERSTAYTTVITVMERLRVKAWVSRRREGRSYRYWPTVSEHEYSAHLMSQVLEGSPDRSAALLSFAGQLTPDEVSTLRRALGDDDRDAAP